MYLKSVVWGKTPTVITGTWMVVSHQITSLGWGNGELNKEMSSCLLSQWSNPAKAPPVPVRGFLQYNFTPILACSFAKKAQGKCPGAPYSSHSASAGGSSPCPGSALAAPSSTWLCKPSDSAGISWQKSSKERSLRHLLIADCGFVLFI